MSYACVRTDNMSGTVQGKDLVSLRYLPGDKETAIENGNVGLVGEYLEGEREVRKATAPGKNSPLKDLALVASEEVVKDKEHNALSDFINLAGDTIRGYRLTARDIFSVTEQAFAEGAALEVGSIVELNGTTKFNAVASATAETTSVGKIIAIENEWYVIEVD